MDVNYRFTVISIIYMACSMSWDLMQKISEHKNGGRVLLYLYIKRRVTSRTVETTKE